MAMDDIIIHLFCIVADRLKDVKAHRNANLSPSEIVTLGVLSALKGHGYRAFYRWLSNNFRHFFPALPDQSRLHRLLADYSDLSDRFLAEPSFFTVIDSYGIELIHPRREGRSPHQIGKKGLSNKRWIVGIKLVPLLNNRGEIVNWNWGTANTHDQQFRSLATLFEGETITLGDSGFAQKDAPPANLKLCPRGSWNDRMTIETTNSLFTTLWHAKKLTQRTRKHIEARLAYLVALVNLLALLCQQTGLTWKDFTL
jgi:hypothetical protein